MASATPTISDKIENASDSAESQNTSPIPPKRKTKAKCDDASAAVDSAPKSGSETQITPDNSRVVFVDEVITKSEVTISTSDAKDDKSELTACTNTIDSNLSPDCQVIAGNTKSKIASFLEKANVPVGGSQFKIVMTKVNVNNGTTSREEQNNKIVTNQINGSTVKANEVMASDQNLESITISECKESTVMANVETIVKETSNVIVTEVRSVIENGCQQIASEMVASSQNTVASQEVNGIKSVQINNIPTVIVTQDASREQRSERQNVSESITKQETTTENLESINSCSDEKIYQTVTVKQSMIATEEVQVSNICIKESTESEKESVEVMRIEEKSNDEIVVDSDKVNSTISITVNDNDKPIVIEAKSIIKEANTISTQTEPPKPAPASKTSPKPTLMKKPTITPELPKLQKVPSVTKIPMLLLDKAVTPEKEKTEIFKVKRSKASLDKSAMFESEPKLTKKQRTSSEQCLSLSKSDSEQATSKKLRTTIELLQHENSTIKKLLESERSAFREYRAVHETEAKKEKAEARRREASLEGQLRAALKGPSLLMKSASTGDASFPDAARLATALENAKSANKSLQEKLQVVIEADKRKAGELRAQHDAHAVLISQMERDSRTQLAKLLEELKSKERQIEQLKKGKGTPTTSAPPKGPTKMAVADQLHFMEGQISRLEHEIQRRDDIIQTLRSSKVRKDRRLSGHQMLMKDSIFKDLLSDVDSAVSSAPNSLSPQPSPDLWYHPHDPSQTDTEDGLLEAAKKQIQDLEKALGLSTVSHQSAQMRASQLEEQLQDLREHADLLEFRCLELEDASEKRNSLEELTDSDSGCTSPENRLKNSVSPQLRRSDSGYKSPTRPSSPNRKNQRILTTPTASFSECEPLPFSDSHKGGNSALAGDVVDSAHDPEGHSEDIKYRLERMMLKTHSESDRSCLEQVLQLLWNLQALSGTLADEDYSMIKHKKILDGELNKSEFEQTKSGKIIATISPYSQKSSNKPTDLIRSASSIEPDHVSVLLKEDSKKVAYGLQESGIFEESDWESKETQTEWCDCACAEPESDLATEVQRLNQIREQLEKSGAIRSKNLRYKHRGEAGDCQVDLKQQRKRDKKKLELYESRIAVLENKISIYESSNDVRDKKLAQRLQREIDLQSKSKNLEFDLSKLRKKYLVLEEERCELEEAENDTRLHCQELEAEFDILTAKLRDVEDQRGGAAESAECYRALAEEYEYRNMDLQKETRKLTEKVNMMEKTIPALVCYNLYNIMRDYSANSKEACCAGGCRSKYSKPKASKAPVKPLPMIGYKEPTSMSVDQPSLIIEQCSSNVSEIKPALTDTVNSGFSGLNSISIKNDSKTIEVHPKKSSLKSGNSQMSNFSQEHNVCDCQEYARYRIEELMVNEMKMKQRIEELEKRELAFLETLTKGDEMWADMEFSYKQKIKENEENEALLEQDRNRWKTKYEELQVKVQEMEENESTHKYEKRKFQEEMKDLSKQKELLSDQVVSSQMELLQAKSQMETNDTDLRRELMAQKRVTEEIQEELKEHKKLQMDTEEVCKGEVVQLKRDMCRAAREMREQELTIGELLQEVHNLEKKLIEVSDESVRQRAELNEKNKSLLCEIKCKTNEVDNMKREIAKVQGLPSAEEELNQSFKRAAKNCKCGAPLEGKRAAKNCKCPIQEHVVRHFEVEEDEMQLPLINQLTKIEKSPEMAKMYKYCKENAEDSLPKTLMYKYCKENAEDSVPKALMHKYCRENIDNEESKAQEYNYNRENIEKAYQKQIEIEEIKIIDNIDRQKQDSIKSVPKHPEIANQKVPPKPIAAKPTVPQNVPKTPQVKPKPTETKPSQPKKPATQPAASQKETHKPKEDHPKETSKSKEVHFTERTHQTEKVHEIVHREKPELPKRKPKVTPTVQATPQTSTKPGAAKKEDTSPKNIGGLPTPPMQLVDRGDNARCQVEDNVCRMLNDSLNCCLDERTAPISQGTPNAQENDGSLMSREAQRVREISEKVKHPYEENSETLNDEMKPKGDKPAKRNNFSWRKEDKSNYPPKINREYTDIKKSELNKKFMSRRVTGRQYLSSQKLNNKPLEVSSQSNVTALQKNRKPENTLISYGSYVKMIEECSLTYGTCKNVKKSPLSRNNGRIGKVNNSPNSNISRLPETKNTKIPYSFTNESKKSPLVQNKHFKNYGNDKIQKNIKKFDKKPLKVQPLGKSVSSFTLDSDLIDIQEYVESFSSNTLVSNSPDMSFYDGLALQANINAMATTNFIDETDIETSVHEFLETYSENFILSNNSSIGTISTITMDVQEINYIVTNNMILVDTPEMSDYNYHYAQEERESATEDTSHVSEVPTQNNSEHSVQKDNSVITEANDNLDSGIEVNTSFMESNSGSSRLQGHSSESTYSKSTEINSQIEIKPEDSGLQQVSEEIITDVGDSDTPEKLETKTSDIIQQNDESNKKGKRKRNKKDVLEKSKSFPIVKDLQNKWKKAVDEPSTFKQEAPQSKRSNGKIKSQSTNNCLYQDSQHALDAHAIIADFTNQLLQSQSVSCSHTINLHDEKSITSSIDKSIHSEDFTCSSIASVYAGEMQEMEKNNNFETQNDKRNVSITTPSASKKSRRRKRKCYKTVTTKRTLTIEMNNNTPPVPMNSDSSLVFENVKNLLTKVNEEVTWAFEMADRKAVDMLSNINTQVGASLSQMKALSESAKSKTLQLQSMKSLTE